jgi:hypothetical protein
MTSSLSVGDGVFMESSLSVGDGVFMESSLSVGDAVTLESTLSVGKRVIIESSLSVGDGVFLESSLSVGEKTFLQSELSVGNNMFMKDVQILIEKDNAVNDYRVNTLSGKILLDGRNGVEINSSNGKIEIGNDDNDYSIELGSSGERDIRISNNVGINGVNIDTGTAGITNVTKNQFYITALGQVNLSTAGTASIFTPFIPTLLLIRISLSPEEPNSIE